MMERVNKEIISFLFKGVIPSQDPGNVREARQPQRTDMSRLQAKKDDSSKAPQTGIPQQPAAPKVQPVRVEQKIGRNDPCPCGSGKKYKNCHGVGVRV